MSLSTIDLIVVIVYAIGIFSLAQFVSREKAGHQKEYLRLFSGVEEPAVVGDRRFADRGQHLGRADRRHVGLRLCDRSCHRLLRMDGGVDLVDRWQVLPADLPQEPHLHDAAVPRSAVRQGILPIIMALFWLALYVFVNLTSIIWLGSIAVNKVAGIDQAIALDHSWRVRPALPDPRRAQGGCADRHRAGDAAGARRPGRRLSDADANRWRRSVCRLHKLVTSAPDHFHMILKKGDPHYIDLPGLAS